ncbi:TadE family type IV pilus minor pilin [Sinomonas albida]|uniref:TadE family type IV pilus minor pilin n=1 Tax=Sinomonas albida TaxID=369942 RepID=UPI00301A9739
MAAESDEVQRASARGAVTAEFAVGIPAVLLLLGAILTAAAAGIAQVRAEEAVRAAAREVARGESPAVVALTVQRMAGDGAKHVISSAPESVKVTVRLPVTGPLAAAGLAATASAVLPVEAPS